MIKSRTSCRILKRLLPGFAAFIMVALQGWSYPDKYGPFQLSQEPKAFPLNECKVSTNNESGLKYIFTSGTNASERIVILQSHNGDHFRMAVERQSDEILLGYIKIDADQLYENGMQVYRGFLNEDNKPDYIVQIWCGGNGLNAVCYYTYFLLSSGTSYHCSKIDTFHPQLKDFIDVNHDGRPEFVHTAFVYGEEGKDGQAHNYWVYNLFQFKKDKIVYANNLDNRFPCWIWYTDKPNHKNTVQLTGEQKRRLWKEQAADLFPGSDELTNEQER